MHKNGLVKFTAILFTVISILQISYTYVVSKIEKDALNYSINSISEDEKDFSIKRDIMQRSYLDSVANIRVFGITSYKDAKEKEAPRRSLHFYRRTRTNRDCRPS